jgi:hypothetical protein
MEPTAAKGLHPNHVNAKSTIRSHQQLIPRMKLSIEAAVAAAVAVAFALFSMVAIAQEHGERGTGSATGYSPTTSAALSYASLR